MATRLPKGWMFPGTYNRLAAASRQAQAQSAPPPVNPPPGSYDPSLDAGYDSAKRQFGYSSQDAATADARQRNDYLFAHDNITNQRDRTLADYLTNHTRFGEDLNRQYANLATSQQQSANAAGVMDGGALQQALEKRTANQNLASSRELVDYTTNTKRVTDAADQQLGRLALTDAPSSPDNPTGGRTWQDRQTNLSRQGVELANFGLDTTASRWYQAGANGYTPPDTPDPSAAPAAAPSLSQALGLAHANQPVSRQQLLQLSRSPYWRAGRRK